MSHLRSKTKLIWEKLKKIWDKILPVKVLHIVKHEIYNSESIKNFFKNLLHTIFKILHRKHEQSKKDFIKLFLKHIYDSFMTTFLIENVLSNLYLNGSNTGAVLVAKSHLTLRHPVDCNPPGSSVQGFPRQECWSVCHVHLQGLFWTQRLSPHLLPT